MSGDNGQNTGRTLGGTPSNEPIPSSWQRPTNAAPRIGRIGGWGSSSSSGGTSSGGRRIATLRDVGSGGGGMPSMGGHAGHAGHGHDDDDDDDEDENENRDEGESWFAGGERSGISVQNPDRPGRSVPGGNLVRDLLRRAAEAGAAPPPEEDTRSSAFFGGGHTLGSDEVESTYIPDPNGPPEPEAETAIRNLTFWQNGFSVEDGPLMEYGDPTNDQILEEINSGRAPPHILNVLPGQPVELRVVKRLSDPYTPSSSSHSGGARVFHGTGNRLGAPVPTTTTESMPGTFPAVGTSTSTVPQREAESISTRFEVDQTQPTTSIQVRLADGTRMVCRMNLTHTVQDIRNFINASRPENSQRAYTIGTTFPTRTIEDNTQTIKEAGLVNSVIVQRWA
ncbi:ubiquitin-related domain-containing protein [Cristinia sonorae]|uniref:Ubiquitin-related domain-containing protein n=1 Tax=Cristinia sonorae TaxID=1940300 RepID=A0A8K0UV01_9AGAR|nr:ubiquitin-related domain-containing protein [Cristinia sonorae]